MMFTNIEKGQTIVDVCLQVYGRIDKIFDLLAENNLPNIDTELAVGQRIEFSETLETIQVQFLRNRYKVNTGGGVELFATNCPMQYVNPNYVQCDYVE